MAHVIDRATMKAIANVPVGTRPREAKFTADGRDLGLVRGGRTLAVIDTTGRSLKRLGLRWRASGRSCCSRSGWNSRRMESCYSPRLAPANRVAVCDTETYAVKQYVLVGQRPWHLALDPDGSKLYVANPSHLRVPTART